MDRGQDRRRRGDTRDHRPRYDRDRSRSPPTRERRDDRRRDQSPHRGSQRGGAPGRSDRNGEYETSRSRNRPASRSPPPPTRRPGDRGPPPAQPAAAAAALDKRVPPPAAASRAPNKQQSAPVKDESEDEAEEEARMQKMLGFKSFRSTKNTKVPGNDKNYGVNKVKKTEYRQYMNRVGGFNRPLSPSRG